MQIRSVSLLVACGFLAACGGGGSATSGGQSPTQDVSAPTPETVGTLSVPVTTEDPAQPNIAENETTTDSVVTPEHGTAPPTVTTSPTGTLPPAGGGATTPVSPPPVVTPPEPVIPPVPLAVFSFDTSSNSILAGSGVLEGSGDRITLSGLSGKISADGSTVILDGGGQITLINNGTDDVGLYQIESISGSPSFGVYGEATDLSVFSPSGSASYSGLGTAIVQIIDGNDIYDLTGNVAADVNFDTALVDVAISGLNGQRTDGLSAPVQVLDAAQVGITGGRLSNGTYEGGIATFASDQIATRLSGAQGVTSQGGLFGDNGDEIGGVFIIDDTGGTGNLLIQGQYVGD